MSLHARLDTPNSLVAANRYALRQPQHYYYVLIHTDKLDKNLARTAASCLAPRLVCMVVTKQSVVVDKDRPLTTGESGACRGTVRVQAQTKNVLALARSAIDARIYTHDGTDLTSTCEVVNNGRRDSFSVGAEAGSNTLGWSSSSEL